MKKKLLATLMGAIMCVTCFSALAACNKQPEEEGGSTEQDGTTTPKTTVDNFDEWYNAIMDTFRSENLTIEANFPEGALENYVLKRSGDNIVGVCTNDDGSTDTKYFSANELGKELQGEGTPAWVSDSLVMVFVALQSSSQYEQAMTDSVIAILWGYESGRLSIEDEEFYKQYLEDEEFSKQYLSTKVYEKVSYNEEEGYYEILDKYDSYSAYSYRVRIKFSNGKISSMEYAQAYDGKFRPTAAIYNFTYGNASVTIPDEAKTETAGINLR